MTLKSSKDLFEFDKTFDAEIIIGTDEAGRGPGAGGVFASAVYFNSLDEELIKKLSCLNDSKKLSRQKREELYDIIVASTINATVCVEVAEIEKINILNASLKAMKLACERVIEDVMKNSPPREEGKRQNIILTLVDGNKLIKDYTHSPANGEGKVMQQCIIKGDSKSASIAAASILAKVSRDRYMQELHEKFPHYNWIKNAGYLTREHLDAIDKYGIMPIHRKTFLRKHFEKTKQLELN